MPDTNSLKYVRNDYDIDQIDPHWADYQMAQWIGSDKKVLEVGCATGYFGKFLKHKRNCKVWGVEIQDQAAALAAPHYEKIWVGDISAPDFINNIDQQFDVILCSNVLEHLMDPLSVLKQLKSKLAPNGFFVVALPNIAHWSIRLSLLRGQFNYTATGILDSTHLKFFTFSTARSLLRQADLTINHSSFDWDNGLPIFNGLCTRLPGGRRFLRWFYGLCPGLFGFQFIFKARPLR